jgi:hypothetical protein
VYEDVHVTEIEALWAGFVVALAHQGTTPNAVGISQAYHSISRMQAVVNIIAIFFLTR